MKRNHENTFDNGKNKKQGRLKRSAAGLIVGALAISGAACSSGGDTVKAAPQEQMTEPTTADSSTTSTTFASVSETIQDNSNSGDFVQSFPNQKTIVSDGDPVEILTNGYGDYSIREVIESYIYNENLYLLTGAQDALDAFAPKPEVAEKYDIKTVWDTEPSNRQKFLDKIGFKDSDKIPTDTYYTNIDLDNSDFSLVKGYPSVVVEDIVKTPQGTEHNRVKLFFNINVVESTEKGDKVRKPYAVLTQSKPISSEIVRD